MKKLLSILVLSCSLLLAGDGTASNTFESEEDKVIINDIPLSYKISIEGSNSRFIADLLDARVIIKNNDSNRYYLEYKFVWYDVGGFEMARNTSKWNRFRIDAKDKIVLKSLAVTPKIDSFKFYVRAYEN
jgi:uncharacterized protein YcfL